MKPPEDRRSDVIAAAALRALRHARWHARDLASRRPQGAAPDLLRGLAGEMAFSPIAQDQVLSEALTVAADEVDRGGDLEEVGVLAILARLEPSEAERLAIRRDVFEGRAIPAAEAAQVVETLESRHRPGRRAPAELAKRLREEARLHELLWDHPRLPCNGRTRLVMLFAVPKLLERAAALDPKGAPAGWKRWASAKAEGAAGGPSLRSHFIARGWIRRPVLGWLLGVGIVLAATSTVAIAEA